MRYCVDSSWWRHSHSSGETVIAGSPPRVLRFSAAAKELLDSLESRLDLDQSTFALVSRLASAGVIHPLADADVPLEAGSLTILIPAHISEARSRDLFDLRSLVDSVSHHVEVIIVDDGSPIPIDDITGARVVRNETARGPAAARNRALDLVTTEFVLFLDADVAIDLSTAAESKWSPLLFHMADPSVAIVAPRVRSISGVSALERYESENSPLDMGDEPARVRIGSRLSYVPSAAILVRMDTLRTLNGFDEQMRYGEDVDFVWRASRSGFECRYEPAVQVFHRPRGCWLALAEQRFHYGTAAAELEARHSGATHPLRVDRSSAAVVALLAVGHPFVAAAVSSVALARLARRLASIPDRWHCAIHLVAHGHVHACRTALTAVVRGWWPITALLCLVSRRARAIAAGAVVVESLLRERERARRRGTEKTSPPVLDPLRYSAAKIGDDLAYGAGVWFGAIKRRSLACLLPKLA